eukprot:1835170-Pyramimonas_sp.AAC.1
MEDLNPNSLPTSINAANTAIHGAAKYSQIGPDACGVIIAELVKGSGVANSAAILCVDLVADVGDWLFGFINTRRTYSTSMFYFGITSNQVELDWLEAHARDEMTRKFSLGEIPLPGGMKLKDP